MTSVASGQLSVVSGQWSVNSLSVDYIWLSEWTCTYRYTYIYVIVVQIPVCIIYGHWYIPMSSYQWSVISDQWSVISDQWSVVSG